MAMIIPNKAFADDISWFAGQNGNPWNGSPFTFEYYSNGSFTKMEHFNDTETRWESSDGASFIDTWYSKASYDNYATVVYNASAAGTAKITNGFPLKYEQPNDTGEFIVLQSDGTGFYPLWPQKGQWNWQTINSGDQIAFPEVTTYLNSTDKIYFVLRAKNFGSITTITSNPIVNFTASAEDSGGLRPGTYSPFSGNTDTPTNSTFKTNLKNCHILNGSWIATDVLTGKGEWDNFMMSSNSLSDQIYSADINLKTGNAAALLLRSDANASHCYVVNFDVTAQNVRLFKFPYTGSNDTLGVYSTQLANNKTYNLTVRAIGSHFTVYFNHQKAFDVTDSTYASGLAGLNVFNGTAEFQNVYVNNGAIKSMDEININTYAGIQKQLPSTVNVNYDNDITLQEAVTWDSFDNSIFETAGTYNINGKVGSDNDPITAKIVVTEISNRSIKNIQAVQSINASYPTEAGSLSLPSELTVTLDDDSTLTLPVMWNTSNYQNKDGTYELTGDIQMIKGLTNPNNLKAHVTVTLSGEKTYYTENYRPQYHFTPAKSWMNDPNGLVYYNGEYHLFYQHNPLSTTFGPINWGHAVSKDMVHWTHLPIALTPDALGDIWSGSAVIDKNDTSGFFGGKSGMVAVYSYSTQKIGIAYSKDNGRTWTKYAGNPVIPNPGEKDFRDPKVFWHEQTQKWIMVVAGGKIHIYSSPNLKDWTLESTNDDILTECPDLFELPVDGNTQNKKWVLSLGGTAYYIGTFDGHKFTPQSPKYWFNNGNDCYAGQTFNDVENRRIMISWMSNWSYAADLKSNVWNGEMTVPYELTLKTTADNSVRIYQTPVEELNTLHKDATEFENVDVAPNSNILKNLKGQALDITAEFELKDATSFGFKLLKSDSSEALLQYTPASNSLTFSRAGLKNMDIAAMKSSSSCILKPVNNRIKLRILIDWSSIEVFGNDGEAVFTSLAFSDISSNNLEFFTEGGSVKIVNMTVNQMKSSWRDDSTIANLSLDKKDLSLKAGNTANLTSSITPAFLSDSKVSWMISDDSIASITVNSSNQIVVTGKKAGTAKITASTYDGAVKVECIVTVTGSADTGNNTNNSGNSNTDFDGKIGLNFAIILSSLSLLCALLIRRKKSRANIN